MKKRYRRLLIWAILILGMLKLNACFQFRESPKKVVKSFTTRGMDVQLKTLDIDSRHLHFVRTSFSDSIMPLAVFIHGSPGASDNFKRNLFDSSLRAHFEMISVDRPGFGHSDFGHSLPSLKGQAALIMALLDSFPDRQIFLIGHSYGGPVIVRMAIDYPERIAGLLIVAGSIDPELEPEEWWRKPANTWFGRLLIPKSMEVSNEEILTLKQDLNDMLPLWKRIEIPVYILQGQKDKLVPPGNADFAEKHLVNSSWLKVNRVDDMNHFFPFTRHEMITEALMELSEHSSD
mgnify:CR=1 FL=1